MGESLLDKMINEFFSTEIMMQPDRVYLMVGTGYIARLGSGPYADTTVLVSFDVPQAGKSLLVWREDDYKIYTSCGWLCYDLGACGDNILYNIKHQSRAPHPAVYLRSLAIPSHLPYDTVDLSSQLIETSLHVMDKWYNRFDARYTGPLGAYKNSDIKLEDSLSYSVIIQDR